MTIKERILYLLSNHPEGIDDDEITRILNLKYRQQANQRCRELQNEGRITRQQRHGKISNFIISSSNEKPPLIEKKLREDLSKKWFWEGNVQDKVVNYLIEQQYQITSVADTATHQRGVDIVAETEKRSLWVSVKGYPNGTKKTNPSLQATHWFKDVIFDMVEYRGRDQEVSLAIALPDFKRYHFLIEKVVWFMAIARFSCFWVREDGSVWVEEVCS